MTPFMLAVQALVDGQPAPEPATEVSPVTTVPEATDTQMVVRALAEQLVSEANAVLREHGRTIALVDETGPGRLAFTLSYAGRSARLQTQMSGRSAVAELLVAGREAPEPLRLTSEDELQSLVLSLLAPPS
jgi:hypothetical protein